MCVVSQLEYKDVAAVGVGVCLHLKEPILKANSVLCPFSYCARHEWVSQWLG